MFLISFFKNIIKLFFCFLRLEEKTFTPFPYLNRFLGQKAIVAGNGPSLNMLLEKYEKGEIHLDSNMFFVNMAPLSDLFYKIKPKHLCLSDFVFARDTEGRTEKVRKMYDLLEERVDWDLTIYLGFTKKEYGKELIRYSKITNPNIHFVFLNRKHCSSLSPTFRNFLYKKGLFMPEEGTVVNTAIYLALIEGYKEIELYGIEHNMFVNLCLDESHKLCIREKNFYDDSWHKIPVCNDINGARSFVHDYMYFIYIMFRSHYYLRQLADYLNAKVYNCTPDSMVDVYDFK